MMISEKNIDDNILLDIIPKHHGDDSQKDFYIVSKESHPISEPGFMFSDPPKGMNVINVQYTLVKPTEILLGTTKMFSLILSESIYFDQVAINRGERIDEILE